MALIDLSPENITKIDLSSFCEQMDKMYFLPEEMSRSCRPPGVLPAMATRAHTIAGSVPEQTGRVSVVGLVSAIDFVQSEAACADDSPRADEQQLVPAHSTGRSTLPMQLGQAPFLIHTDLLESTVDWCGQPTPRAQWLKKRVGHSQRRSATSAAAAVRRPSHSLQPPQQPRATSARPASAASIGAEYRDLTESEVAADVAVRHLGGSSCSSPDERRYWVAAARRPYPIRKGLPVSRRAKCHPKLEFVSLFGPAPEKLRPRPSGLSEASASAFEPPPASPSSRPATATAASTQQQQQQHLRTPGRPLIGRPRPPTAAGAVAVASSSDFGDVSISPRPQATPAAAAVAASIGEVDRAAERRPPTAQDTQNRRLRHPLRHRLSPTPHGLTAAAPAELAQLQLLGNRFRYHDNSNGLGAASAGGAEPQQAIAPELDTVLAELENIVGSAVRILPSISFGAAAGHAVPDETVEDSGAEGVDTRSEGASNASGVASDKRPYSYSTEAERAAVVIQSGFRGFTTRRRLSRVEQLARAHGFESLKSLRRYYCELVGSAAQHRPDAQEMLNFLENKRRIELAFDTAGQSGSSVANLTKVFNVCGQFPSRQQVEQAVADWRRRRCRRASPRSTESSSKLAEPLDRLAAVEIFYGLLLIGRGGEYRLSPRRSPRPATVANSATAGHRKLRGKCPPEVTGAHQPGLSVLGLRRTGR